MQNKKQNITLHWRFLSPSGCLSEASKKNKITFLQFAWTLHPKNMLYVWYREYLQESYKLSSTTNCWGGGQGEVSFDCISYLWKTIACIVLSDTCVNLHVSVHQTWRKLKTSTKTLGQGTKNTDHIFYCSHCHTT